MCHKILLLVSLLFLFSCANQLPPSGGPPDTAPPNIINTVPLNNTLNFSGKSVTIEFDKYMNKNKVKENILIIPDVKVLYDWSGKELEIEFDEELDSNTTYSISIGTDYTDIRNNKPENAFSLIFSTGNNIDSGSVRGMLHNEEPEGVYIYAYRVDNINPDTLDIKHTKSKFVTQVGKSGSFMLNALKDGDYRIFAIRDKMRNGIYDEGLDAVGTLWRPLDVKQDSIQRIDIKIGPPIDKIGPALISARALSAKRILATFSEEIDTISVSRNSFSIKDSLQTKSVDVKGAFISSESGKKVEILFSEAQDTTIKWMIGVSLDPKYSIRDTSGNVIRDTSSIAYYQAINFPDDSIPKLSDFPFRDSVRNVSKTVYFDFIFNTSVTQSSIDAIKLYKLPDSTEIELYFPKLTENIIRAVPKDTLFNLTWYLLKYNGYVVENLFDGKSTDSIYEMRFETIDERTYSGVSGELVDSLGETENCRVILSTENGKTKFTTNVIKGKWKFSAIPKGEYFIEVHVDSNKDGKFNYGAVFPFEYSERFHVLNIILSVKPRWEYNDIMISIP